MILVMMVMIFSLFCNAASNEAANVLVVVNDATVAEAGTNGVGASQFVADHYIAARGIPLTNVVHINSKGCCGFADGPATFLYNNYHVSVDQYTNEIANPIKAFLESHNLKQQIKYIVNTYGVPSHIGQLPPWEQLSVDSFLSQMYLAGVTPFTFSPLYNGIVTSRPAHYSNIGVSVPVYMVTRLDAPTALIASGLVDKAMVAERGIVKSSGVGYFDFQGGGDVNDLTMLTAYNSCVSMGLNCLLNTQQKTGHKISDAPNTLWAWGWYGEPIEGANVYKFLPGAVGSQLQSDSAYTLRGLAPSLAWCPLWLTAGITATWGATFEPFAQNYAKGDNLLNHLWNGYTFGEASYISNPVLGWMMVFVGDPLYSPVFGATSPPPIPPASVPILPLTITITVGTDGKVTIK